MEKTTNNQKSGKDNNKNMKNQGKDKQTYENSRKITKINTIMEKTKKRIMTNQRKDKEQHE